MGVIACVTTRVTAALFERAREWHIMDLPPAYRPTLQALRTLMADPSFRGLLGFRVFWFGAHQTRAERAAMLDTVPVEAQRVMLTIMKDTILGLDPEDALRRGAWDQPLLYYMATDEETDECLRDGVEDIRGHSTDWRLILIEDAAGFLCDFNGWPGDNECGAGVYVDRATGQTAQVFSNSDQNLETLFPEFEDVLAVHAALRNGLRGPEDAEDDTMAGTLAFDLGRIPDCLREGFLPADAFAAPPPEFVGEELAALELPAPPPAASTEAWVWNTWCADCVSFRDGPGEVTGFNVRRWYRGIPGVEVHEELEYWVSAGDDGDFLAAHRRGDWFLVVCCVAGHAGVATPAVSWGSGTEDTNGVPLPCGTPEELIAAMPARAKHYVERRTH